MPNLGMKVPIPEPCVVKNTGSTARDYCMLERNILSHIKLALLLSLMSSSMLLRARLVPDSQPRDTPASSIPMASIELLTAFITMGAGVWEYRRGYQDLRIMRPFLGAVKPHISIMGVVTVAIFATCIVLLVSETQ